MRILHIAACSRDGAILHRAGSQIGELPKSIDAFAFRRGCRCTWRPFTRLTISGRRNSGVGPSRLIDNHLPAEFRIRQDFEERGVYNLVIEPVRPTAGSWCD